MDHEHRTDPEDDIAAMLHLAGRRPRLAEKEVAPIREAAREVFRRQARRAARRRRLGWTAAASLAAGLLLAAGLFLYGPASPASPEPKNAIATIEMKTGDVAVAGATGHQADLFAGAVLTTGAGRAAVRLPYGASMRIDAGSSVRIDSSRRVTLTSGALYVDSGADAALDNGIEVATALGSIRDVGTQFEVRLLAGTLRVRVREGRVLVAHEGGAHQARAGGELLLREDGSFRRAEIPRYGPGWDWVQRAAPALDIEGATLRDFLDWVSRETGLRWRLAEPPRAGRRPEEIVLHGSIQGLTAEQALAVVLPGCGYRHRLAGDRLWLENVTQP